MVRHQHCSTLALPLIDLDLTIGLYVCIIKLPTPTTSQVREMVSVRCKKEVLLNTGQLPHPAKLLGKEHVPVLS